MALVFEFNTTTGGFRDRITGEVPQNVNNVDIYQGTQGRAGRFDGNNYLQYNLPNFRFADSQGTIGIRFKDRRSLPITEETLFSTCSNDFLNHIRISSDALENLFFSIAGNGAIIGNASITPPANLFREEAHNWIISSNGSRYQMFIDGIDYSGSITGNNSGAWFNLSPNRLYVAIGAFVGSVAVSKFPADILALYIYDTELDANGRALLSQKLETRILLEPKVLNDKTLHITGLNWNATGQVQTKFIGNSDFAIGSGSFRCIEDSIGKYIECVVNGTLQVQGVNLSIFPQNGYIHRIDGDLSGNAGQTVNVSALSFANNVLSIPMTSGQKIRNLTIGHNV